MTIVVVAVFVVVMLRGAGWLYGPGLSKLTPDQRVTAIDDVRGRMIQVATGVLAIAAVIFTGLNYGLSREGHVTDRYTRAIEQLGSASLDVRLGAIYALERIMIDSPRDHPTIVEVLAAFAREHAKLVSRAKRRSDYEKLGGTGDPPPYTDVQAVLTVLGRRPAGRDERGSLNLQRTDLSGADLTGAVLPGTDLFGADLTHARLPEADLSGARLRHANMEGVWAVEVDLSRADLERAKLHNANLTQAKLSHTNLSYTDLTNAHLNEADLRAASLVVADMTDTDMNGADLTGAGLNAATMVNTKLIGAKLVRAVLVETARVDVDMTDADTTDAIWQPVPLSDIWKHLKEE